MRGPRFFLLLLFTCFGAIANAQTNPYPCKDTLETDDPYFQCFCDYDPVCGCDGKTYRNPLLALNGYHINYYENGPCDGVDFDIRPSLFALELQFEIYVKQKSSAEVYIRNIFGKQVYQYNFNSVDRFRLDIDTQQWEYGVYVITVIVYDGTLPKNVAVQSKKIVKTYTD